MDLTRWKETQKELYDYFEDVFPSSEEPEAHLAHYIMCNRRGKLTRPLVMWEVATAYGARVDLFPHAAALETIHRVSLALDDLPSMDDANLRQGRQSAWSYAAQRYGGREEGIALAQMVANLLSGTNAPELIDGSDASPDQKQNIHRIIRTTSRELVKGQCQDLGIYPNGEKRERTVGDDIKMYELKTGSLYAASAEIGGWLGGANKRDLQRLRISGRALGVAYQLKDDEQDLHDSEQEAGKPVRLDERNGRPNLASRLSPRKFRKKVHRLARRAIYEFNHCSADLSELVALVKNVTQQKRA